MKRWQNLKLENGYYHNLPVDGDAVEIKLSNDKVKRCEFFQDAEDSWGFGDRAGIGPRRQDFVKTTVVAWRHI